MTTPSLALGLLQASLEPLPARARQRYFSLRFARLLGVEPYLAISRRWGSGHQEIGEWVFAGEVFPDHDLDPDGYLERILREPDPRHSPFLSPVPPAVASAAVAARRLAGPFLDACLAEVEEIGPRLVGLTCLFQQRLSSLALARRIKARRPETFLVLGGVDCEGVRGAEVVRRFPFVDAVVSGPADRVFPELVSRVMEGRDLDGLEGVLTPGSAPSAPGSRPPGNAPGPSALDELPFPAFEDYFEDLSREPLDLPGPVYLSLETSRGCWWGERSHCAFCSINGSSLSYRSKTPARVVEEVSHFARLHPGKRIVMTDSILDPRHVREAIPPLSAQGLRLEVQYECRSSLSKAELKTLRDAGVTTLQPGIESLSSPILRRMRKGTTLLQNLRVLKWARELGLRVFWNLLVGFPGEPPEEYAAMERLVPLLTHLPPPQRFRLVEVGRHSPLFEEAESFGLTDVLPSPAYAYLYPFGGESRSNLASCFTYGYRVPQDVEGYSRALGERVLAWQTAHEGSALTLFPLPGRSLVRDSRSAAPERGFSLDGLEDVLLRSLDDIRSLAELERVASEELGRPVTRPETAHSLETLERLGFVVREEDRFLGLVVLQPPA